MPVGYLHIGLRKIASWALAGFFKEIHVIGDENVPKDGPVIVCCTHHNMMIDPAILSNTMPDLRPLRYWAKASLFKPPIAGKILLNSGNIPVDRGSKDKQKLFAGTFTALAENDAVALFPEGTSYTLPRIVQVKDGASWAAMEYLKWVAEGGSNINNGEELIIVPAGITYTDKTKYRSSAVIEYGRPISLSRFKAQFLSGKEGDARLAVKALTHAIEQAMIELTVNAPNWEALLSAMTARDLLFGSWRNINLDDFRSVGQTLVDLFSTPWDSDPEFISLKRALVTYNSLLKSTHLTNSTLASLPLPKSKKSSQAAIPSRLSTVIPLLRETFAVLIRLPFFFVPLLIHLPIYYTTRWIGKRSEAEEETVAQGKVVVGLLLLLTLYGFWFFVIWALFFLTPVGAVIAAASVWALGFYHGRLIDDNYLRAKRLVSAWRVLVGIWGPQKWDMSLSSLTQYTTIVPPPPNQFLKLSDSIKEALSRSTSSPAVPTIASVSEAKDKATTTTNSSTKSETAIAKPASASEKRVSNKRPPSRRLIRHLLRARADAARQLAAFLRKINNDSVRVAASGFMAAEFGGGQESLFVYPAAVDTTGAQVVPGGVEAELNPSGWRHGKEVVTYLESKGAKIGKFIREQEGAQEAYEWEALRSDEELSSPGSGASPSDADPFSTKGQDLEWVVPTKK